MADPISSIVKGTLEFAENLITRPRVAENWAGPGEYEKALITKLKASGKYPSDRFVFKGNDQPFLIKLYDHYTEYGKRWFPNRQGMKGAGVDMEQQARTYINGFIDRNGGVEKLAFLFEEITPESLEIQRLEAELKALQTKRTTKNVIIGVVVGTALIGGGALAYRKFVLKK